LNLWQIESTEEHRSGTISPDGDPANVSDRASKCAIVRGVVTESSEAYEVSNVVESALARALLLAAEAGVVTSLAGSPPSWRASVRGALCPRVGRKRLGDRAWLT